MAYADKDLLIADYIPGAKSQAEKDAIERILDSVSTFVDRYCKRAPGYFSPSPNDPSIRRVRGEGQHFLRLPVHLFGSITSVNYEGTVVDSAIFYESDKNGWLYFEDSRCHCWYPDSVIKVTARWGYAETPKDLAEAVRLIVLRVWETQKGVLGQITPNGFVIERAMPPLAKEILDRYKKRQFEI